MWAMTGLLRMNERFPAESKGGGTGKRRRRESVCVCVCVCSFRSDMHVRMDGGDAMSGIDLLNMAPSQRDGDDDVIHGRGRKNPAAV